MKGILLLISAFSISVSAGENSVITYSFAKSEIRVNGQPTTVEKAAALYNSAPTAPHETCMEFDADMNLFEKWNAQLVNDGPPTAKGWSSKTCP
jgi:hypothetical protein